MFMGKGYEWREKIFDFFYLFCFSHYLYFEKAKFGTEFDIRDLVFNFAFCIFENVSGLARYLQDT